MSKKTTMKPTAAFVGAALVGSLSAMDLAAGENPFSAAQLERGYMQLASSHDAEGKCGEGKCGEGMKMEGKCGEGKCGEGMKTGTEGGEDKDKEGKCGEGKCGGDKG
jgi:uncharacterized low-complexity protein